MSENCPKVSVIIPSYNAAKYICQTIESVFNQTYRNFEIIVVDDGSTDDTKERLKPYLEKIRYYYKKNGGPASARNLGIKNAKGKYIAFLDADDLWLPEKLELQVKLLDRYPDLGFVHSDVIAFDEYSRLSPPKKDQEAIKGLSGYIFQNLFIRNGIRTLTAMAKKECFEVVGFFNESPQFFSVEDYDMWLRISRKYEVGYIDTPLSKYRIHQSQISRNIDRSYMNEKHVIEEFIKNHPDMKSEMPISPRHRFAKLFFEYGCDHFAMGNLRASRDKFLRTIKYRPIYFKAYIYYLSTFLSLSLINYIRVTKRRFKAILG